jgi:hypothetical protein
MDQHHADPQRSSLRVVLRLLVLAGAAVVWWLVISGGPAQADAPHPRGVGATATVSQTVPSSPVSLTAPGMLDRTVAVVTGPLRDGPGRVGTAVDRSTAPAPRPVQTVVGTLEPALTTTTARVADVVDRTATTVEGVVEPVLRATGLPAHASGATPSASASAARRVRHDDHRRAAVHAAPVAMTKAAAGSPVSGAHLVRRAVQGVGDTRLPRTPAGQGLPAPASSGTVLLAGVLAGLALLPRTSVPGRAAFGRDPLPLGPAYPPGSSPG